MMYYSAVQNEGKWPSQIFGKRQFLHNPTDDIFQYSLARHFFLQGRNFQLGLKLAGSILCVQATRSGQPQQ